MAKRYRQARIFLSDTVSLDLTFSPVDGGLEYHVSVGHAESGNRRDIWTGADEFAAQRLFLQECLDAGAHKAKGAIA